MNIAEMSKDELAEYAKPHVLDMRKGIAKLREEVAALKGEAVITDAPEVAPTTVKMLINPKTGFIFEATPELLKNPDLEPHS